MFVWEHEPYHRTIVCCSRESVKCRRCGVRSHPCVPAPSVGSQTPAGLVRAELGRELDMDNPACARTCLGQRSRPPKSYLRVSHSQRLAGRLAPAASNQRCGSSEVAGASETQTYQRTPQKQTAHCLSYTAAVACLMSGSYTPIAQVRLTHWPNHLQTLFKQ